MKSWIFIFFIFPIIGFTQQTITDSLIHDNVFRSYALYVPLVFNLHGMTGTAWGQMWHGDFRDIADTANFIIVHPQGLLDSTGVTHWNIGQSTVDDIGFLNSLHTHLISNYNIDVDRVYSAGMSNGGYMSYYLACDMSDKIAAIASVTGAMSQYTQWICNPTHPTPIMEIHGTADIIVPFNSIISGLNYWRDYNNCNLIADTTIIPDLVLGDMSTVEHIVYNNGDNGVTTELFKIINGDHSWPGSSFPFGITNYDIDASIEIWKFFSRYDINGEITTNTSIQEQLNSERRLLKTIDVLGREVDARKGLFLFFIYSDGSTEKVFMQ